MESKYDPRCSITDIEGSLNLRDLGGMPISGGRIFPYKRFLRSGSLSECSPDILDKLKEYGVTTVIDLRSKAEVAHYGNPAIGCDGIDFYNIPLFLGDPDSETDSTMEFLKTHHLGDFYIQVLEGLGSSVVDVLNTISRAPGCSLFHCAKYSLVCFSLRCHPYQPFKAASTCQSHIISASENRKNHNVTH